MVNDDIDEVYSYNIAHLLNVRCVLILTMLTICLVSQKSKCPIQNSVFFLQQMQVFAKEYT